MLPRPADGPARPVSDFSFGPFRFDGRLRRLYKDGEPVVLTPKALDTLLVLLKHAGEVVQKDELLSAVWDDVVVGDDTLAQNVSTLRRVLGDDPANPDFIATVPRRGYRFIAPVRTEPASVASDTPRPPVPAGRASSILAVASALVLAAGIGAFATHWLVARDARPVPVPVQFTISEPDAGRLSASGGMLSISPDGTSVAFVVIDSAGATSLWLRPLASSAARPLPGTDAATNPFWSPDSRTIAFFSNRRLKAVDVASGAVRVVASLASARSLGGTWSRQGQMLLSIPTDGLYLVEAAGGSPQRLDPPLDPGCTGCATWPYFLPDGRRFLYTVVGSHTSPGGVYVGEIGKAGGQLVLDVPSSATYVAPGFLSYARAGTLFLQPFDATALRLTGPPIPVSDGVAYNARTGRVVAATSDAGVLAFRKASRTELVWVDRTGAARGVAAPAGTYHDFAIAPDGRRIAAARVDPRTGTSDIWVFDADRERRVTDDVGWDGDPVWSDDGRYVAYSSRRAGRWQIYRRPAMAVGSEELLLDADGPVTPLQFLRSNHIVYSARRAGAPYDTWTLEGQASRPIALLGGFVPGDARLSPDEQWVAYGRPESGSGLWRQTVYVSGLPFGLGETRRAVAEAGSTPRWRADGRELFFLSTDSAIVAIPVDPDRTPSDSAGGELFRLSGLAPTGISGAVYDVTRDGRRFLFKREVGSSPIQVIVNWDATNRLSAAN